MIGKLAMDLSANKVQETLQLHHTNNCEEIAIGITFYYILVLLT